jgi:hypothetical protein
LAGERVVLSHLIRQPPGKGSAGLAKKAGGL